MNRWIGTMAVGGCLGIVGCAGAGTTTAAFDSPLVVGPVESITHHATGTGLLVRAAPGSSEMCGIQATATAETRYLRRTASSLVPAALSEIQVGDTVEVHVTGEVAQSCPVQGGATAIVLR